MAALQAGQLDRRVRVERAREIRNSLNEPELFWDELCTVWCSARPLDGSQRFLAERLSGGQLQASRVTVFKVRWSPILAAATTADRIVFEGVVYNIQANVETARRSELTITAQAAA